MSESWIYGQRSVNECAKKITRTNQNSPNVDKDEEDEIDHLVKREHERE